MGARPFNKLSSLNSAISDEFYVILATYINNPREIVNREGDCGSEGIARRREKHAYPRRPFRLTKTLLEQYPFIVERGSHHFNSSVLRKACQGPGEDKRGEAV